MQTYNNCRDIQTRFFSVVQKIISWTKERSRFILKLIESFHEIKTKMKKRSDDNQCVFLINNKYDVLIIRTSNIV